MYTSKCTERLSLVWKGVGAIAFLVIATLPSQAADLPTVDIEIKQAAPENNTAEDLKPLPAQTDGPPELPVLEPYIFLDQPVSVPPIAPLEAPTVSAPTAPSISVPPLMPVVASPPIAPSAEAANPIEAAETVPPSELMPSEPVPSEPVLPEPVPSEVVETAEETNPSEVVEVVEAVEAASEPKIPLEPPFLGDLAEQITPAVAPSAETLASDSARSRQPTVVPTVLPSAPETATQTVPPIGIRPGNVSRWPEPIPFGQPLPNN
ncbi:MAG: hypothetical protein AAF716_13035 [Cyanobacteria bacterium P01_D01_bin.1]